MAQDITKQSVALGEFDRKIVNKLVQERGLNFSSALRFIIREWKELTSPTPGNGNSQEPGKTK